jgi:uncharacterized membrane protein
MKKTDKIAVQLFFCIVAAAAYLLSGDVRTTTIHLAMALGLLVTLGMTLWIAYDIIVGICRSIAGIAAACHDRWVLWRRPYLR